MLENENFFFRGKHIRKVFSSCSTEFLQNSALYTHTHKQTNSQKANRGIEIYNLDENKHLFIRSVWPIKNKEGIQANYDKGYPYILGYS